nr:hypothetical protein [Prolixibacteraceae bacterium]
KMKTIKEKKLEVALLKEKLERISGKKIIFEEKENVLVPRDQIDNRDEKYKQKIYKLLQQKIYDGDLDLSELPFELEDLGKLEKVNGYLDLKNTSIKSLGNLEKVNGYLDLANTPIKDLGNLKYVGRNLYLDNTPIKSLGNLEKVTGSLWLENTPITDLGNLKEVGGKIFISKSQEGKMKGLEKLDYRVW